MASPAKRKQIQAALKGEETPAEKQPDKSPEDAAVQQDIMDPSGAELELSFDTFRTYPLTMLMRRRLSGFVNRVSADAFGGGARSVDELTLRSLSLILSRSDLEEELFRLFAIAIHKPGTVGERDERLAPFIKKLLEKCDNNDSTLIYGRLVSLSKSDPKAKATTGRA